MRWVVPAFLFLAGCGRYRDFTLPKLEGPARSVTWTWRAAPNPVLGPGAAGEWDSGDVLNPSVWLRSGVYWNLYSGFDGKTWHTGVATSRDGVAWRKLGRVLSPDASSWEGGYIAANGSAIERGGRILYFYQAGGRAPSIGVASSGDGLRWAKAGAPVLAPGPRGSWDERGVADPYAIEAGGRLYMFYLGMDRARRQRLGVAESSDGSAWYKLRGNPVLELGDAGAFDENGLGEPAVWAAHGAYWMLYTGRDRREVRRLGMARSVDGVHWEKQPVTIAGEQGWDAKVICDPSVIWDGKQARVWFGGGDVARPDEGIHGRIGVGVLEAGK